MNMMEQEKDIEVVEEETEATVETFTQEEVDKLIQQATDKRVSQALETAKQKWQKEVEHKTDEAKRLAAMSEEERFKAQLEQERSSFESERQAFMRERMELETVKQLSSQGLPTDFANYLVAEDATTVADNINTFKEAWQAAVEAAVVERLKGGAKPVSGETNVNKTITKEQFEAMSFNERLALYEEQPELYNSLVK